MALLPGLNIATSTVPKRKAAPKRKKAPKRTINLPAAGLQQARAGRPAAPSPKKKSGPTGGGLAAAARRGVSGSAHGRVGASASANVAAPKKMVGIGPAAINIAPAEAAIGSALVHHTPLKYVPKVGLHALSDIAQIGESPFVGGSQIANMLIDSSPDPALSLIRVAEGKSIVPNFHSAIDFGKEIYGGYRHGALGELVTGHPKAALKQAIAHPVFSALDLAAGAGAVGRTAGSVSRAVGSTVEAEGLRGAAARAGSTVRPPVALQDEAATAERGYVKQRTYSKDKGRQKIQKAIDDRRPRVTDAEGKPVSIWDRGQQVEVLKPRGKQLHVSVRDKELARDQSIGLQQKRADYEQSIGTQQEKVERGQAEQQVAENLKGDAPIGRKQAVGDKAQQVASLVATGTVRTAATLKADLLKRADEIEEQLRTNDTYHSTTEQRAAADNAKFMRDAANDPKVLKQARAIVKVGEAHGRSLHTSDIEQAKIHIADAELLHRSRLREIAVQHYGVRHVTEAEHAGLEKAARVHEDAAHAKLTALAQRGAAPEVIARLETRLARAKGNDESHNVAKLEAQLRVAKLPPASAREFDAARAEHQVARQRRIQVSGRHPEKVAAHEGAIALKKQAHRQLQTAKSHFKQEKTRRDKRYGAIADRRGVPARPTTAAEKVILDRADARVARAKEAIAAATRKHRDATARVHKNPEPPIQAALRTADGKRITTKQIEELVRTGGGDARAARDPDTIGFLPHREGSIGGAIGRRAFHKQLRPGTRPVLKDDANTGALYRRGGNAFGTELVREQLTHAATSVGKAQRIDRMVHDKAMRYVDARSLLKNGRGLTAAEETLIERHGGYMTPAMGDRVAQRLKEDTGLDVTPIRSSPAALDRDLQAAVRDRQDPVAIQVAISKLLNDRVITKDDLQGRQSHDVVLYPTHDLNRHLAHMETPSGLEKLVQMINNPFRMAVLPQPRWLTGDFFEPYFTRLPLKGAGALNLPGLAMDVAAAKKYMSVLRKDGSPGALEELKVLEAQVGTTGAKLTATGRQRRTYEDFPEGSKMRFGLYLMHEARNNNRLGTKSVMDMVMQVPKAIFAFNHAIGKSASYQSLGKSIREDIQAHTGSWLKTVAATDEVITELRNGHLSTATMNRYLDEQHKVLGQYEGFSPGVRRAVQTFFPFLPWTMASARFVWLTMPLNHTGVTSFLIHAAQINAQQWKDQHANLPPGSLKLANVQRDGGLKDRSRYTSYGFSGPIVEGDLQGITDTFFPQVSGSVAAVQGKDAFGRDLQVQPTADNPKGTPSTAQKFGIALQSLIESGVFGARSARVLREKGGTAYADSTLLHPKTKPGTSHSSAAYRLLYPDRSVYLKAPGGGAGRAPAGARPASSGGSSVWDQAPPSAVPDDEPKVGSSIWDK